MEAHIKGSTGLYCLIGSPVGHSGSPAMYNFCFNYHKQDFAYLAFDIKEEGVESFINSVKLLNIKGFNVTMPCKRKVAELVDHLSPQAAIIGACNTVINDNGTLIGHITDGTGFVLNLKDHGEEVGRKNIILFGAGGAAIAIMVECAMEGAASIKVYNRGAEGLSRVRETAKMLSQRGIKTEIGVELLSNKTALREDISSSDILINATSLGMKPREDTTVVEDESLFHHNLVVADIVYNPKETRLMKEAGEAGVKAVIGGEGMLLWQGAAAYKLFTGMDMPVEEYKKLL